MILKLYWEFLQKIYNKEAKEKKEILVSLTPSSTTPSTPTPSTPTSSTPTPSSTKERLKINNLVKEIIKKDSYDDDDIEVLKKYTGFGGLNMGDKDEYFTPKALVKAITSIVPIKSGDTILDPCTGGGIFPLVAKETVDDVKIKAIEPNPLSAKVASAILNVEVESKTFEEVEIKSKVDHVITNVPFGIRGNKEVALYPQFDHIKRLETFIIIKSLMSLKPLGMGVFITNSRLMDGKCKHTQQILSLGEVWGAVRLPNAIFADAGADVITDIVVIRKHDKVVDFMSQADRAEKIIKPFNLKKYFEDNPSHIIGTTITKEEQIEKALADGKKIHHQAQKDRVETNMSNNEVFKEANRIMKTFSSSLDYKSITPSKETLVNKRAMEQEEMLGREVRELFGEISSGKINISKIKATSKKISNVNNANAITYKYHFDGIIKLYELGVTSLEDIANIVNLKPIKKEVWERNKSILQKIALTRPSYSTKSQLFEKIKEAYMDFVQSEEKRKGTDKALDIPIRAKGEYSDEEMLRGIIFIGDGVFRIGDENLSKKLDGMNYEYLLEMVDLDSVSSTIITDYKKMLKRYFDDNVSKVEVGRLKIDLELGYHILEDEDKRNFIETVGNTLSIEKKLMDNVLDRVATELTFEHEYTDDEITSAITASIGANSRGVARAFTEAILWGGREPRFRTKTYSNLSVAEIQMVNNIVRAEFYGIKDIIEALFDSYIKETKSSRDAIEEYANAKSVFVSKIKEDGTMLHDIGDIVKKDWLEKAHHFQNADARVFSESEEGTIRYDTGLGKSLEAMLISAKLIKSGKKVAYIVPNEIIGKMEEEAKKIFSTSMLREVLVVTSDNKKSILNASSQRYKFLLMTSSVLTSQFDLSKEITDDIYGVSNKESNAGNTSKYGVEMGDYVKYPKYNKTAQYKFEDLGIDTMIVDEAHRFKNAVSSSTTGVKGLTTTSSNNALIMLYFAMYIKYVRRGDGKGVILSTATPITSSPTEMLSLLLFSTDVKGLKRFGIEDGKKFEKTFFNIVQKESMRTDGTMAVAKVLEGIKNLDILRNLGWRKVVKRTAEEESIVAEERGKKIDVKPSYTEYRIEVSDVGERNRDIARTLNMEYARASMQLSMVYEPQSGFISKEVTAIELVVLKEFGELFSLLDSFKKLSVSLSTSKGYTKIKVNKEATMEKVLHALSKIKVKVKFGSIKKDKYDNDFLDIKLKDVLISSYADTPYSKEKKNSYPNFHHELLEEDIVYLPSLDYATIKKAITALKKAKLAPTFESEEYVKLGTVADTVSAQFVKFPTSKQIIYSPTLSTHHILEELITKKTKGKIKFFHFNGSTVKNAEKKLQMQLDFNSQKGKTVLIFGASGKVGVDFNMDVSSVHLVDVGLTPEDKEQAKGRAVRQGNKFSDVSVFHYYSDNTLDSFLENIVSNKQDWIDNVEDNDFSSSTFNSDSLETISKLAEKHFPSTSLSLEQKISKYLEYVQESNREKRKSIDKALTEQEVQRIVRVAKDFKDYRGILESGSDKELERSVIASTMADRRIPTSVTDMYPKFSDMKEFNASLKMEAFDMIAKNWNNRENTNMEEVEKYLQNRFRPARKWENLDELLVHHRVTQKKDILGLIGKDKSYLNDIPRKKLIYKYFAEIYNGELREFYNRVDYIKNLDKTLETSIENIRPKLGIKDTLVDVIVEKLTEFDGERYLEDGLCAIIGHDEKAIGKYQVDLKVGVPKLNSFNWTRVNIDYHYEKVNMKKGWLRHRTVYINNTPITMTKEEFINIYTKTLSFPEDARFKNVLLELFETVFE